TVVICVEERRKTAPARLRCCRSVDGDVGQRRTRPYGGGLSPGLLPARRGSGGERPRDEGRDRSHGRGQALHNARPEPCFQNPPRTVGQARLSNDELSTFLLTSRRLALLAASLAHHQLRPPLLVYEHGALTHADPSRSS